MTSLVGARSGAVLGAVLAILIVPPVVLSAQDPSIGARCGVSGQQASSFQIDLARAEDIWLEFPAMMRAPEAEGDSAPASLVVFPSGFNEKLIGLGGNRSDRTPTNLGTVLCLVQADGEVSVFTNVAPAGSRLAP